ncbi:hypothetical protein FJY63_06930, partial [Candidatus Sumerlaeota bacterium]|nr:hypothetical protein [Candidatus Sumerlaeota bacterium]
TYSDYTRDPSALYAAKRQAIEEMLDLDSAPQVIVQTNPLERSTVAADCAIDVHGWAEPGTSIRINRQKTPVAPDGLFMQQVSAAREGAIVVEAQSEKGRKTIVRKFTLVRETAPPPPSSPKP